jgi:hypothetical protein
VGDVGVVGVVAGPGEFVQAVDERERQFQDGLGRGDAGVAGLGAKVAGGAQLAQGLRRCHRHYLDPVAGLPVGG